MRIVGDCDLVFTDRKHHVICSRCRSKTVWECDNVRVCPETKPEASTLYFPLLASLTVYPRAPTGRRLTSLLPYVLLRRSRDLIVLHFARPTCVQGQCLQGCMSAGCKSHQRHRQGVGLCYVRVRNAQRITSRASTREGTWPSSGCKVPLPGMSYLPSLLTSCLFQV